MHSEDDQKNTPSNTIVSQLLQAKTENETSTYRGSRVVVDEDGNKVIQVRKRKRVYSEKVQDKKTALSIQKFFITASISLILLALVLGGLFVYRVSSFNSADFLAKKEQELSELWGAKVQLSGLKVEAFSFSLASLKAEFPESSLLKSVEMQHVSGDMSLVSLITGVIQGDKFSSLATKVLLRNNVKDLQIPLAQGENLWRFNRFETDKFHVEFDDKTTGPFILSSGLYARKGDGNSDLHLLQFKGTLYIKGWSPIEMTGGSPAVYISKQGIDAIDIRGNMEDGDIELSAEIPNGSDIYRQDIKVKSSGAKLKGFTKNYFEKLLTARLGDQLQTEQTADFSISLPTADMDLPIMKGKVENVKVINMRPMPIYNILSTILGSQLYLSPTIPSGSFTIASDGKEVGLSGIFFEEDKFIKITGAVKRLPDDNLEGALTINVPLQVAELETFDHDPIFTKDESGQSTWLKVNINGTVKMPMDNSAELNARAAQKRQANPRRFVDEKERVQIREQIKEEVEQEKAKIREDVDSEIERGLRLTPDSSNGSSGGFDNFVD